MNPTGSILTLATSKVIGLLVFTATLERLKLKKIDSLEKITTF